MNSEERIPRGTEPQFETRQPLAGKLAKDILEKHDAQTIHTPYLIGIEGSMASGKGKLTAEIASQLRSSGKKVQIISADHYMNPPSIRKGGADPARQYSERTINIDTLEVVLAKIRDEGEMHEDVEVYDVKEEQKPENERKPLMLRYDIDKDTIVLVEGIFTLKDQIKHYYDKTIYIDVSEEEIRGSAAHRNRPGRDKPIKSPEELEESLNMRQIPGYNIFKAEDEPRDADYVLEREGDGWRIAAVRGVKA